MCMCVPFFLTTDDSEKERNISTTKRSFPNPALSTYAFFFAGDSLFTVLCNVISLSFFFFWNKMEYKKIDSLSLPPIRYSFTLFIVRRIRFSAALTKESSLRAYGFVRSLSLF